MEPPLHPEADTILAHLKKEGVNEQPEKPKRTGAIPRREKFQGALLLSAIGDALGWPTEFLKAPNGHRLPFKLPIHDFVGWHKLVGGKWWGYDQYIEPGMYSDDTQLALAIARSITDKGEFDTERACPIKREGYIVKLIHIQFDSGQTCVFHSRVHNNEQVSESLTQELVAALQDDEVK